MRTIRVLLMSLVCALAMLPARAAWAAIDVTFVYPGQRAWIDGSVSVQVQVSSTLQIARVTAQLGAGSVILTNTGGTTYRAGISMFGLPYGEHILTVTATDVTGTSVSAQRTVLKDQPPTVQILAPRHESVAHPALRLAATCVDDHPEDCTIRVLAVFRDTTTPPTSVELARGTAALDTVVDLSALSGRRFGLEFNVIDTFSSMTVAGSTIHVETSPLLTAIEEMPGQILDFDGSRILFVNARLEFFSLDRATRVITRILKVPLPYPSQFNETMRGFLTGAGAVIEVPVGLGGGGAGTVYEWRDGALLKLAEHGRLAFVSGDYMAYSGSGTYLRDLASGTDELALGAALDRSKLDVAEDGLLAYVEGRSSLYTRRNGTSTLLATSAEEITRPVTDGRNVVFTRILNSGQHKTILATPSGQAPLGVAPVARPEGAQTGAYQLHAGYIAFLQGPRGSEQVWLRTPSGAQHQLSFFSTPSQLDDPPARLGHDGVSDTGEVMFLNPPKRYLGAPGAAPREIGSRLGHARWFEGAWYVVMGNTLFEVDDGSSGEGEGGGASGAGEARDRPELDLGEAAMGEVELDTEGRGGAPVTSTNPSIGVGAAGYACVLASPR